MEITWKNKIKGFDSSGFGVEVFHFSLCCVIISYEVDLTFSFHYSKHSLKIDTTLSFF